MVIRTPAGRTAGARMSRRLGVPRRMEGGTHLGALLDIRGEAWRSRHSSSRDGSNGDARYEVGNAANEETACRPRDFCEIRERTHIIWELRKAKRGCTRYSKAIRGTGTRAKR